MKELVRVLKTKIATILVSLLMLTIAFYAIRWYIRKKMNSLNPFHRDEEKKDENKDLPVLEGTINGLTTPKDVTFVNASQAGISSSYIKNKLPWTSSTALSLMMKLEADTCKAVIKLFKEAYDVSHVQLVVVSGYRTMSEQNELYKLGRTRSGGIVTNAKAGKSWHNYGQAVDVMINENGGLKTFKGHDQRYKIGYMADKYGMNWGGFFTTFKDEPHFQYKKGQDINQKYSQLKF